MTTRSAMWSVRRSLRLLGRQRAATTTAASGPGETHHHPDTSSSKKKVPVSSAAGTKKTTKAKKTNSKGGGGATCVRGSEQGPGRSAEFRALEKGYKIVAGLDEAGRGPLAGPVVAGACIIPPDVDASEFNINDSKKMTEEEREAAYERLMAHPRVLCATAMIQHDEIDQINILQAAMKAMACALENLPVGKGEKVDYALVDGPRAPKQLEEMGVAAEPIVKGDSKEMAIAAASVLAKVTRDRIMLEHAKRWPIYEFEKHKGYPTPAHKALVLQHGPCPIHRLTFAPIKSMDLTKFRK